MDAALRAGVALYNAGEYLAAHHPWEERWLDPACDADDERFYRGLVQATAATHHARTRNWSGATGLATSAPEYLSGVGPSHRDVGLDPVRRWLATLAADPAVVERRSPPSLRLGGRALALEDLRFAASASAASALAETHDYDPAVIDRAASLAREEGEESTFAATVVAFVTAGARRPVAYRRLAALVERREREYRDVDGLF